MTRMRKPRRAVIAQYSDDSESDNSRSSLCDATAPRWKPSSDDLQPLTLHGKAIGGPLNNVMLSGGPRWIGKVAKDPRGHYAWDYDNERTWVWKIEEGE